VAARRRRHPADAGSLRSALVQHALAPLCVVAVGAAFVAETRLQDGATALSALGVVPVLAASMLRARLVTAAVVALAVVLQAWGAIAGLVERDAAGMQVSVYLLVLAVAALQQSRSAAVRPAPPSPAESSPAEEDEVAEAPQVIRIAGLSPQAAPGLPELPGHVAVMLTRREREVVTLAVQGFTAREIGSQLYIGERTVETHLANAYAKLNVRSKLDLVRVVNAMGHADFRTGTEAAQQVTA
jgi:DNA-binding NarL/FixJ family response regulator